MNFGIQDACNLGWKLGMVLGGKSSPHLLKSYHLERWPLGHMLVGGTDMQTKLILSQSQAVRRMQYMLFPIVGNHASTLASKVAPIAGETIYSYRRSPLSVEHWRFESLSHAFSNIFFRFNPSRVLQRRRTGITRFITKRIHAGDRVPHAVLSSSFESVDPVGSNGASQRSTSAMRLLFGGETTAVTDYLEKDVEQGNFRTVQSLCSGAGLTALLFEAAPGYADDSFGHGGQETDLQNAAWKLEALTDGLIKARVLGSEEHAAQRAFGVFGQCLFLVRPDGYIAFRSQPVDVSATIRYLQETMGVKTLMQVDSASAESASRESDLETVTRMLGAVMALTIANIFVTLYTRS